MNASEEVLASRRCRAVNARLQDVSPERRKESNTVAGIARSEIVLEREPHAPGSRWTLRQRMGMVRAARTWGWEYLRARDGSFSH